MEITHIEPSIKSHFLNLYNLALSDNTIDASELELLYKIGIEKGINKEDINNIVLSPGTTVIIPNNIEEKISNLYDLARLAWADGKIKDEEIELIEKFCSKYGFLDENVSDIAKYLLEKVKEKTSPEELITQIKKLI